MWVLERQMDRTTGRINKNLLRLTVDAGGTMDRTIGRMNENLLRLTVGAGEIDGKNYR